MSNSSVNYADMCLKEAMPSGTVTNYGVNTKNTHGSKKSEQSKGLIYWYRGWCWDATKQKGGVFLPDVLNILLLINQWTVVKLQLLIGCPWKRTQFIKSFYCCLLGGGTRVSFICFTGWRLCGTFWSFTSSKSTFQRTTERLDVVKSSDQQLVRLYDIQFSFYLHVITPHQKLSSYRVSVR